MATKTTLIDDVTGEDGAETRTFFDGARTLEIDLTDENWTALGDALSAVAFAIAFAREVKPRSLYSALSSADKGAIRKALKKSPRARVSDAEVAAWESGHPSVEVHDVTATLPAEDDQ